MQLKRHIGAGTAGGFAVGGCWSPFCAGYLVSGAPIQRNEVLAGYCVGLGLSSTLAGRTALPASYFLHAGARLCLTLTLPLRFLPLAKL
jgi:hypothetical protein